MRVFKTKAEALFQAAAEPTRIRMLRLFAETDDESCLCDLSAILLEPSYKLSRHLKILRACGLLTARKEGRWVYHRLVKGVPYLLHFYNAIHLIPDADGIFAHDLSRYRKLVNGRKGPCRGKSTPQRSFKGASSYV